MTDLAIKVLLKYDGSGIVGQVRATKQEIADLKAAANDGGKAIEKIGAGAGSTRAIGSAARDAAQDMGKLADAGDKAAATVSAITTTGAAAAQKVAELGRELRITGSMSGTLGQGMLRAQANTVTFGGAAAVAGKGVAQLGEKTVEATAKAGLMTVAARGLAGMLGAGLAGAIGGIVVGLGESAVEMLKAESATDANARASEGLAAALDRLRAANDLNVESTRRQIAASKAEAEAHLLVARAVAAKTQAKLRDAMRDQEALGNQMTSGSFMPAEAGGAMGLTYLLNGSKIDDLKKQLSQEAAVAHEYDQLVQDIKANAIGAEVVADLDKVTAATENYRDKVADLNKAFREHRITEDQLRAGRREAEKELKAAQDVAGNQRKSEAAARKSAREAAAEERKEAREAAQAQRELQTALEALERTYDPVAAAARKYRDALADIAKLSAAGKINAGQRLLYEFQAGQEQRASQQKAAQDMFEGIHGKSPADELREIVGVIENKMQAAGKAGGKAFRDEGIDAAIAIGDALGGRIGGLLDTVVAALAVLDGDAGRAGAAGGPAAGLAARLMKSSSPFGQGFQDGYKDVFDELKGFSKPLTNKLDELFGGAGTFSKTAGKAFAGASVGAMTDGVMKAFGVKSSSTGAQIGGAIGSMLPIPGGSIIGSVIGGLTGGLFKKHKIGYATIGAADDGSLGVVGTGGNKASFREAGVSAADDVTGALDKIAQMLGGSYDASRGSVSIGMSGDSWHVDTTGQGRLRKSQGGKDFNDDYASAVAYATADLIKDGVLTGLSTKVQAALKSSPDLDKAVAEALKVDQLETLLGGVAAELVKPFKDFERQAAERVRIAKKYGFDLVKLEEVNAKERAEIFEKTLSARIGSLQQLLKDFQSGDLFEGTAAEQRRRLLDEIDTKRAAADAGVEGAADDLADLIGRLVALSKDAFGTAGPEYGADRDLGQQIANEVIKAETDRAKAAQDEARKLSAGVETSNKLLDENADQNAKIIAQLQEIAAKAGGLPGGIWSAIATGRSVSLS